MIVGACIAMPGIIGATMAVTATSAVLMMAIILCGYQFYCSNIQTLAADFHYGKTVGSLAGLGGAAAVLGTILAMYAVPYITTVSWVPFFILGGSLFPISIMFVFLFGGKIQNIDQDEIK
jgi:ACS family hexuronate transporter-like MFS transporter